METQTRTKLTEQSNRQKTVLVSTWAEPLQTPIYYFSRIDQHVPLNKWIHGRHSYIVLGTLPNIGFFLKAQSLVSPLLQLFSNAMRERELEHYVKKWAITI